LLVVSSTCLDRLPEKVAADRDGLLVVFGHSDIGVLNQVSQAGADLHQCRV